MTVFELDTKQLNAWLNIFFTFRSCRFRLFNQIIIFWVSKIVVNQIINIFSSFNLFNSLVPKYRFEQCEKPVHSIGNLFQTILALWNWVQFVVWLLYRILPFSSPCKSYFHPLDLDNVLMLLSSYAEFINGQSLLAVLSVLGDIPKKQI